MVSMVKKLSLNPLDSYREDQVVRVSGAESPSVLGPVTVTPNLLWLFAALLPLSLPPPLRCT